MSSEALIQEAEKEILNPQHSFDMVIPGEVRVITTLSWDEKIFYALIRNLCRLKGYCWATNDYLAKEMKVCERTIKNWMSALLRENLIEREIIFYQMKRRRRIWLKTLEFKKVIIGKSASPSSGNAIPHGRETDCPYTEESITKENKDCLLSGGADGQKISSIECEKPISLESPNMSNNKPLITKEQIFQEAVLKKKNWTAQEICEAYEIMTSYKGLIRDSLRFIDGTISKLRNNKKSDFLAQRIGNKACLKAKSNLSTNSNENLSEQDSKDQPSQISLLDEIIKMR